MLVSNLLFDIVLFGVLLAGGVVDKFFPQLAGAASLVAVGVAVYIAAQEWSDALLRRKHWTQEALSTAVALSVLGFIYFWWRNGSDLSLLALSVVLMMASLMVAIATIGALGSMLKDLSPAPLAGWLLTAGGGIGLGILGGVLALFLGNGATLFAKVLLLGIGLFGWKIRETIRPPDANVHAHNAALPANPDGGNSDLALPATHAQHWFLIPQRGTLLDRLMPVLVIGAVLFVAARQIPSPDLWTPTPPASADNGSSDNGSTP
jgi:hypothetical protein